MSKSIKQKSVSYVHGFKVPTKLDIEKALGKLDDDNSNAIFNNDFFQTFNNLPSPTSTLDWLAQNKEKGQTYAEYVQLSRTLHTPASYHRKTIYLTLFGPIDNTIFDMDSLIDYTQRFFQMDVKLIDPFIETKWNDEKNQWICKMKLSNGKIRDFNIRTRYDDKTKHSQICVTSILNLLKKIVPYDCRCLVALTMHDLYGDDTDLFIAGLSMANCRVAAFSFYRYDPYVIFNQSDWFDYQLTIDPNVERRNLLLIRSCCLLTHEICHLFGIDHCIYYSCLMNGSGNLDEDFSQPLLECPIDLRKLYKLIGFNIHARYEQLLEFFKIHNFLNGIQMVETKLNAISNHPVSNTIVTTNQKRKRTKTKNEEVSQSVEKYRKCS